MEVEEKERVQNIFKFRQSFFFLEINPGGGYYFRLKNFHFHAFGTHV